MRRHQPPPVPWQWDADLVDAIVGYMQALLDVERYMDTMYEPRLQAIRDAVRSPMILMVNMPAERG